MQAQSRRGIIIIIRRQKKKNLFLAGQKKKLPPSQKNAKIHMNLTLRTCSSNESKARVEAGVELIYESERSALDGSKPLRLLYAPAEVRTERTELRPAT